MVADSVVIQIDRWTCLEHKMLSLSEDRDTTVLDDQAGRLYVFEHNVLRENRLKIGARHGTTFDLSWEARCDVFAGDFDEDLPLLISTPATFNYADVRDVTVAADALEFLAARLNLDQFVRPAELRGTSASMYTRFRPLPIV